MKNIIKITLVILAEISMFIVFGFFVDFAIVCFNDLEMSDERFKAKLIIGYICIAICLLSYLAIVIWSCIEKEEKK